jgi:hypothetical protein
MLALKYLNVLNAFFVGAFEHLRAVYGESLALVIIPGLVHFLGTRRTNVVLT